MECPNPALKILDIKYRHCVPLASFEDTLVDIERLGGLEPISVRRFPEHRLAICDYGRIEVLGCDDSLPADLRDTTMLVTVAGLTRLARDLAAKGALILEGPEPGTEGLWMRVRHRGGEVVDYLEPR